jgi:formylmethanofuran dehydrogenase subunit E
MMNRKSNRITAIGILTYNTIMINDEAIEWIDAKEFSLATLAQALGIYANHKVKAKITIEVVEEPCELCGKPTTGDKICEKCGKIVCDNCAKTDLEDRYCPFCFNLVKQPEIE